MGRTPSPPKKKGSVVDQKKNSDDSDNENARTVTITWQQHGMPMTEV